MKRVIGVVLALLFIGWPLAYWKSDATDTHPYGWAADAKNACTAKTEASPETKKCVDGQSCNVSANVCVWDSPQSINWADHWFGGGEGVPKPFAAMAINFAILAAIYVYAGKKPIAQALENRRATVAKEIEEADRMRREAEARAKQYQVKLERMEEELETAKAALVDAARGEKDRIIKEAEEKAARMQKDAEFLIEQEMKQIRQDLWRETVETAVATAEELLKKRITPSDQERLADDYLEDLVGRQKRTPSLLPKAGAS